jgi:hypothetical protein
VSVSGIDEVIVNKQLKPMRRFVNSCCLVAPNARYRAIDLYLTYVNWCINHRATVYDQFYFLEMLQSQGFEYNACPGKSYFEGITVLPRYRVE